jgi:hypothetical protein
MGRGRGSAGSVVPSVVARPPILECYVPGAALAVDTQLRRLVAAELLDEFVLVEFVVNVVNVGACHGH